MSFQKLDIETSDPLLHCLASRLHVSFDVHNLKEMLRVVFFLQAHQFISRKKTCDQPHIAFVASLYTNFIQAILHNSFILTVPLHWPRWCLRPSREYLLFEALCLNPTLIPVLNAKIQLHVKRYSPF